MRSKILLTCLPALALLTACGGSTAGYYDSTGTFIPMATETGTISTPSEATRARAPYPGHTYDRAHPYDTDRKQATVVPASGFVYDRQGFYDYRGNYVVVENRVNVPQHMLPARGMCRVWFPDRAPSEQPRVETCAKIQERVPVEAYVIYGG